MTNVELKVFCELLRDSKQSDRELARVLGVSQPTVTRLRHKLVREGWVRQFTVVPGFLKLGFRILVFSFFRSRLSKGSVDGDASALLSKPEVVFAAECNGMGMDSVVVSLHGSYSDYVDFVRKLQLEGGADVKMADSVIIGLEGSVLRHFTLGELAGTLQEKEA